MTAPLDALKKNLLNYHPDVELLDEAVLANGKLHPSWQYVLGSLSSLGTDELEERQKKALRILRDDGATYNIYGQGNLASTWLLDLIPFLIDSAEWGKIEAGLQERAELFDLILKDIYGERELVTRGIIPPEIVFGHKSFLRSCHDIKLPGEHQLIIHAVDMLREPDGHMCILADRTQAPSGSGYALENRTVMSRVLPSLFRDSHVHRLSNYFQFMRQKLLSLAPAVANPRIVVLTPGSYNETYFEHSYLADYLGFTLVQSGDLEVKNGFVWLKSLDGLKRVDVILRRVDDYFCDPVELKGDSQLGIPGLLQVIRSGNVAVANPLGSGILENPALLCFLPQIARHFLGRELRLKSVQTWWCGLPEDLDYVLNNLDTLVVKSVFRSPNTQSHVVSEISKEQRQNLLAAIKAEPHNFVAQEKLLPSHIPVFADAELVPRPALLRTFSVATEGAYRVMPGGLTRAGKESRSSLISSQLGSVSKDTWVLASEPEKQAVTTPLLMQEDQRFEEVALPSRVVENLFWMGRYAERAENGLRLIRNVLLKINSTGMTVNARNLLLQAVTQLTTTYPGFIEPNNRQKPVAELEAVIFDAARTGTVSYCIQSLMTCAEETKGLMSADNQRVINDIHDQLQILRGYLPLESLSAPAEALNPIISSMLALSGIVQENMQRDIGWTFLDIGRRIERAMQTIGLMRALLTNVLDRVDESIALESLLSTFEGLTAYRRRFQNQPSTGHALELTLLDSGHPRSVLYQLGKLEGHIDNLPLNPTGKELEPEQRTIVEANNLVRLAHLSELSAFDESGTQRATLNQLLSRLYYLLGETSNLLSHRFFEQVREPRQLVEQKWSLE